MSAKQEILGRVRAALGSGVTEPSVPREYRTRGRCPPGAPELVELLADRLRDYHAGVHRSSAAALPAAIAAVLAAHGAAVGRVVVPPGIDPSWAPGALTDTGLGPYELDAVAGAVTGCALAIAETGTIVLDGSAGQGRRVITLMPDLHVCVVRAGQVVQTVPEAIERLEPTRPLTWVSGPSATSDIELNRVEGVHGPRRLEVLLVSG